MPYYSIVHSIRVRTFYPRRVGTLTGIGPIFRLGLSDWQVYCCDCGEIVLRKPPELGKIHKIVCGPGCPTRTPKRSGRKKEDAAKTGRGFSNHPLYSTWSGIHQRCYRASCPAFVDYGARGIKIWAKWKRKSKRAATAACFRRFCEYMGDKPSEHHSIDRIDVNGNYEPGNVRWATLEEQMANRRNSVSPATPNKARGPKKSVAIMVQGYKFSKHPLYGTWYMMKSRCLNPKDPAYVRYGGAGIGVWAEWVAGNHIGFLQFLKDLGPKKHPLLTLERKDPRLGYNPTNCEWADRKRQANNKLDTKKIEYGGAAMTLGEWATHLNIPYSTLHRRHQNNLPMDKVFCKGRVSHKT